MEDGKWVSPPANPSELEREAHDQVGVHPIIRVSGERVRRTARAHKVTKCILYDLPDEYEHTAGCADDLSWEHELPVVFASSSVAEREKH